MIADMIVLIELGMGAVATLLSLRYGWEYARVARSYPRLRQQIMRAKREVQRLESELEKCYKLSGFGKTLLRALREGKVRIDARRCKELVVMPGKLVCVKPDGSVVDLFSEKEVGEVLQVEGEGGGEE